MRRGEPWLFLFSVRLGLLPFLGWLGADIERPAVVPLGPDVQRLVATVRQALLGAACLRGSHGRQT